MLEYRGTKFIFGFLGNNSTAPPQIYIVPHDGDDKAAVFVSINVPLDPTFKPITATIPCCEVTSITLPTSVRMTNGDVGNNGK